MARAVRAVIGALMTLAPDETIKALEAVLDAELGRECPDCGRPALGHCVLDLAVERMVFAEQDEASSAKGCGNES